MENEEIKTEAEEVVEESSAVDCDNCEEVVAPAEEVASEVE